MPRREIAESSTLVTPWARCVRSLGRHARRVSLRMAIEDAPNARLMDRVRRAIRVRHYSRRTEEAYACWITLNRHASRRACSAFVIASPL